ncbi:hypothetical protein Dsin_024901 [Dipteronia sinensis]|uniref:RNase H type-1 domain-containing protein n=1 Tax=Dipteronia sinensis TaxID=43782 RepID=A0AAE0DWL9_9ROSI|nr:hypothetical protein Dsin_024901 [Dipteronia sinensis]
MGLVVRNHLGLVMATSAQRMVASDSPQAAEAITVLRGIELAIDTGLVSAVIESDALGVVNQIKSRGPNASDIGIVVDDIVSRFSVLAGRSVDHVSRKANFVAHTLSRMALTIAEDRYWMEDYPPCVEKFIHEDYLD